MLDPLDFCVCNNIYIKEGAVSLSSETMATGRMLILPEDVVDRIWRDVHGMCVKEVCEEIRYTAWMLCGDPMFVGLRYEGLRRFCGTHCTGANDISAYISRCWEPYVTCRWCKLRRHGCACNGSSLRNCNWSDTDSTASSDLQESLLDDYDV